ncbi:MAG: J domain-containing protein [Synechococcus sp.]|nr:J domain-containing protein [Synechococcus sp.]
MPSHYTLLQLAPDASPQDLRQAFRSLSKRFHPDTTTLPPAEAAVAFQRLQEAYAVLSDPQRRRAYDDQLRRAAAAVVAAPPPPAPVRRVVRRPEPVRRPLSGGEWFALLLLACALVLSLVLGLGLAWARGVELMERPSWWSEQTGPTAGAARADVEPAAPRDTALQPPPAPAGGLAAPAGGEAAAPGPLPVGSPPAPVEGPDRAGGG